MSIANIVFRLTFNQKKAMLKIQKSVVEEPRLWSITLEDLCASLDEIEKTRLIKICDILQESIDQIGTRHLIQDYQRLRLSGRCSQQEFRDNTQTPFNID